jgi:hypothetical protein
MDHMGVRRLHVLAQVAIPAENHATAALTAGGVRLLTCKVIDGNSRRGQSGARSGFGVRFADYHNAGR